MKTYLFIDPDQEQIETLQKEWLKQWDNKEFCPFIKNADIIIYAEIDDKMVAGNSCMIMDHETIYSSITAVLPEYRGKHIATDMIKYRNEIAKKFRYKYIISEAQTEEGYKLMKSLGGVDDGESHIGTKQRLGL